MQNIKNYVEGLDIKEGLQFRSNCPSCGGKNTFTGASMALAKRGNDDEHS